MISIIICTTGERIKELSRNISSIINQSYPVQLIIVSQDNHQKIEKVVQEVSIEIQHIKNYEKGLSVARNVAMKFVKGDILLFGDDDNWYVDNIFRDIETFMFENNYDICCFQYYDITNNISPKDYSKSKKNNLSYMKLLKVSSIEIVINLKNVDKEKIRFNESFGVGTENPSGEENILLTTLKKTGYKISYEPKVISYHLAKAKLNNTNVYNKSYFLVKHKLFKVLYGKILGSVIYFMFSFRKKMRRKLT